MTFGLTEAQAEIEARQWIERVDLDARNIPRVGGVGIDAGEREVISLARAWEITPVIDEPKGRREAIRWGLQPLGTLGILGLAVRQGLIPKAGPLIQDMRSKTLRFGDELVSGFLRALGERWPP